MGAFIGGVMYFTKAQMGYIKISFNRIRNSANPLKRLTDSLYGIWFATVFSCLSLVTVGIITVIPGQPRRRLIVRQGARLLLRLTGAWPNISGLQHLPSHASVIVANHASYLDGVLLTAVLPHRFQFVIKREMTQVPLAHYFLRRIGAHFVDRSNARKGATDARRIMQTATNGGSLVFFPEGTFRREPGLRRFQNGAFTVALRQGLPLIPLVITGTRAMLPAHSWLPRPAKLAVIIKQPLPMESTTDPNQAREECRQHILAELNEPDLHATIG
ncbi:MAG: 1-acyl-sn-glycerol-3-phosphate acyltransferase [Gammaproteobacteria bacterium]|nr:MAG: 1-acyl-sn-glycerol-3-phosphate acyltransferase [Gammaproteobacteria bacterium]